MKKRIISITLILTMIFTMLPMSNFTAAFALSNADALTDISYQPGKYYVLSNSLNVRSGPSASYTKITSLSKGKSVTVSSVKNGWGQVNVNNQKGWIDLSYAYSPSNKVDISARLDMLRLKFPDGKYWNRESSDVNNADGYTENPCVDRHSDKRENYFDGTCQCHGFALKLGYDLFGIHAANWERHYDLSKVKVGDLIRYRSRHTVMVTGVYSDYFTVADCNWDYCCGIDWDRVMKKSYISFTENQYDGIYHCPANGGYVNSSGSGSSANPTTTTTTVKTTTTTTTKATTTTTAKTTTAVNVYTTGKLTITGDVVNVRSGAGTNYSKVASVKKNYSYTYTKEKTVNGQKWYYIKVNSKTSGWICGDYAKVTQKLGSPVTTTTTAAASKKVKITGDVVNVRSSASTSSKIVTQVKKNSVYKYTEKKTVSGVVWYKIKVSSSKSGWICGKYCKAV
ncbi:MAG: SH3 domain-containing protein [Firmicutes bacterium]|nr:SH3 domain-containing protein [Bacillota bacterium]